MAATVEKESMRILSEKSYRISGEEARRTNITAARAIAEFVRTSLGPKGMEKMLFDASNEVIVTNDGAAMLNKLHLKHPCAKLMAAIGKTQEREVGDGTKTAVILTGELLKGAEELLEINVHPTVIVKGYEAAQREALKILREIGRKVESTDEDSIRKIASTALNSKILDVTDRSYLVDLVIQAVKHIAERSNDESRVEKKNIKIQKRVGGSIKNSKLVDGIILEKKERVYPLSPKIINDAKIAVFNTQMMLKRLETDAKLDIATPEELNSFLEEEEEILKDMVWSILEAGANCVFNFKTIDDDVQYWLAKKNILAVKTVPEDDIKLIAKATGAKILTHLKDLTPRDLGKAKRVEEKKIGEDEFIFIEGCENPKAITILLQRETEHGVDELEKAVDDVISVVKTVLEELFVLPGGGAAEIEVARKLRNFSKKFGGKEQLAIEKFANAMEAIPMAIAENAGFDPIDALTELRSEHENGYATYGIDLSTGKPNDMLDLGVIEPLKVKEKAVTLALETAVRIIRVDDIIAAKAPGESKELRKKFKEKFYFG